MQDHILIICPNFVERRSGFSDSIGLLDRCSFHLGVRIGIDHRCFNLYVAKILREQHHGHSGLV